MRRFLHYIFCLLAVVMASVSVVRGQSSYPIYVSVQVVPPAGLYLTDYYSGTRDRLVVTLINRDNDQPLANVKLRVSIRNSSIFELRSREELHYPMLTLESGVPLRLTSMDLEPYLAPERVTMNGYLDNGKLPNGMTEFRVQALDYTTGRVLSEVAIGRIWLESKQPPILNQPSKGDLLPLNNPLHMRFSWMPRHQGLANTSYEFVLKELPNDGAPAQTAFLYGPEIYKTETRRTTLDYGTIEPPLEPGKRYGWQVRAKVIDGIDEIGVFDNQGYSEVSWFELSDNCPEVKDIKAIPGFRKIDISWYQHPDQNAFVVQWRPKTQNSIYEWESTTVFDNHCIVDRLNEGWTYEYRVGALCIRNAPVFSQTKEILLPEKNEERLKNCGKVPNINLTNQEPNDNLQVGDLVTIGGDFPMKIDELTSLGNGWYSGTGGIVFPWVFDVGVSVEFTRLRVNTDNVQIDGEVETSYDTEESAIGNTNQLDYGGAKLEQGGVTFDPVELEFTIPPLSQVDYNPETGELVITDENGENPQTVPIPKNEGKSSFPMEVVDADGNRYQIDMPDEPTASVDGEETGEPTGESGKESAKPTITKVEDVVGILNLKELSKDAGFNIRFSDAKSKYAFDDGRDEWYQNSKLLRDDFYKPIGTNYIAPWKLVPVGEIDYVEATVAAPSNFDLAKLDRTKVKFIDAQGKGVAAKDEGGKWILTVPAIGHGQTYDILAVYQKSRSKLLTVGKLRVVCYAKQNRRVTLVPVGVESPDVAKIQKQLNDIYAPYGVEINVGVDDAIRDLEGWKGRTFKLEGNGFFTRENADMTEIRKAYQSVREVNKNDYYVFVLGSVDASSEDNETQAHGAQGDMPRGQRFGYVFSDRANDIGWLLAHELGHGIFTLKHLNDGNYAGKSSLGSIRNLMDYTGSVVLGAFQWNVMSNPAVITAFDSDQDSKVVSTLTNTVQIPATSSGVAPDGRIIARCTSEKYKIIGTLETGQYYLWGIRVIDPITTKEIESYKWNGNDYVNGNKVSIADTPDIYMEYVKAGIKTKARLYLIQNKCQYQFVDIMHTSGQPILNPPKSGWRGTLFYSASDDCRNMINAGSNTGKRQNAILFVSGYDPTDVIGTMNNVYTNNPGNYWDGLDALFMSRRKATKSFYASGDLSISTSNHRTAENVLNSKLSIYTDLPLLNTTPNIDGFNTRFRGGQIAGREFVNDLISSGFTINDTLDIVCHSMGFAYAQGMIAEIQSAIESDKLMLTFGGYYIIAPENGCSGIVDPTQWEQIWQYGSNEAQDPISEQDGIAPQCKVGGLYDEKRAYIPDTEPRGFVESHTITNYKWIFNIIINSEAPGYVTPRK